MKTTLAALAAILALGSSEAQALTIVPTYNNSGPDVWTNQEKAVVNQAITDWQSAITNNYTISVTLDFTHVGTAPTSYLGQWSGSYTNVYYGDTVQPWSTSVTQAIHINADLLTGANYLWFDPTPTTSSDQPFVAWDALSVVRHEIGHMLGFTNGFYITDAGNPGSVDLWGSHITTLGGNAYFDAGTLNSRMAGLSNLGHVYDGGSTAGDLMVPSLVNGVRHDISQTDLGMLHNAYGYTLAAVPEPSIVLLGSAVVLPMLMRRQRRAA